MIESWPYFPDEPGAERVCFFDLRARLDEWHETTPWLNGSPPPLPEWMKPQ